MYSLQSGSGILGPSQLHESVCNDVQIFKLQWAPECITLNAITLHHPFFRTILPLWTEQQIFTCKFKIIFHFALSFSAHFFLLKIVYFPFSFWIFSDLPLESFDFWMRRFCAEKPKEESGINCLETILEKKKKTFNLVQLKECIQKGKVFRAKFHRHQWSFACTSVIFPLSQTLKR